MALEFSDIGKWYKDEVGDDDGFDHQDFMAREYAGERALFDIKGKTERFSASIGASWYYAEETMTIEDLAAVPDNVICYDKNGRLSLNGQPFHDIPLKATPLNIEKPLPPVPIFDKGKVNVENVDQIALDSGLKLQTVNHGKAVAFDYMFADASEAGTITIRDEDGDSLFPDDMVEDEDDAAADAVGPSTPPQVIQPNHQPRVHVVNQTLELTGLDMSAVQPDAFLLNAIPTASTPVIENHILALAATTAASNSVNEQLDPDKAQVTNAFFNGCVEESPSPYHIPLLDDDTGFGDIREDAEDFPELWKHIDDEIAREEAAAAKALQPVVKPDNNILGLANRAQVRKAKQAAAITNANVFQEAPVIIDLTGDENGSETLSLCKKRRAHSSFATKSSFEEGNNDDDVQYLYTKKARVASCKDDDEVFTALRPSIYSLITQPEDADVVIADPVPDSHILPRICGEAKGFSGQFQGMRTYEQTERAKKLNAPKVSTYIGQASHLNNLILHKDMHVCPQFETTEYNPATAPADSDIGRCISYANTKTDEAANIKRSPAEEFLRREAHHECTMARLQGTAVGKYRYFEGHMTVEEYHECRMCICWELCECSKLCTRFADLVCPCATKIETNCR